MEAAGIEPASRDISMPASTCVAGLLPLFAGRPPVGRVPGPLAGNGVLPGACPAVTPDEPELGDQLLGLSDKSPQPGLPISRQPTRRNLRQLKIVVGF